MHIKAGLLCWLLILSACSNEQNVQRLTLTGSSTVAPLAAEIARAYEQQSRTQIDVQTGGSSRGIADVSKGLADIGMASRALKASEQALTAHTIAWDGISLIVHKDNPISSLNDEQIRALFRGEIQSWSVFGGAALKPVIVNKAAGRSTLELFLEHFSLDSQEVHADIVIGDNQQGLKTVAGNPAAIGYVSIGAAIYEIDHGAAIKLLPLSGIAANLSNVASGRFPLARPLNLLTNGKAGSKQQDFLAFAQSPAVTPLIQALFFVPAHAR
ncbi:MAG: phosphate ABC transporter substrate-binding protein [Oceanococcus sp.]